MDKKAIRLQMKNLARQYPLSQEDAAALWKSVSEFPGFVEARTVLVYMSMADEVPTGMFLDEWHSRKRLVIPLVQGDGLLLKEYNPPTLVNGYCGILEPSPEAPDVAYNEVDFAIVPGVAFDRNNYRLGRGKGFYDRLLPHLDCPKVGVCQPFRLIDKVPCDPWDVALDAVISI